MNTVYVREETGMTAKCCPCDKTVFRLNLTLTLASLNGQAQKLQKANYRLEEDKSELSGVLLNYA